MGDIETVIGIFVVILPKMVQRSYFTGHHFNPTIVFIFWAYLLLQVLRRSVAILLAAGTSMPCN